MTKQQKKKVLDEEKELVRLLRQKAQHFLRIPGVTSVGVGHQVKKGRKTKRLCIQYTVEKKLQLEELEAKSIPELPKFITDDDGKKIPVDVIERSYEINVTVVPEADGDTPRRLRRSRRNPVMPGVSISHHQGSAGTLGAFVYDRSTGQPYVLSNWHVLQGAEGKVGDRILQPGPHDGGDILKSRLGRLVRGHLGLAGDCAVSSIENRGVETQILELARTPARIGMVNLEDRVIKSGRTTGVTHGIVTRVGVVVKITYRGLGEREIGGFEIEPNPEAPPEGGEISEGGDSGSCWLMDDEELSDVVVGLHFAGESDPDPAAEHALACNIHSVLEKLKVSFNPQVASESECALLRRQILISDGQTPSEEDDAGAGQILNLEQLTQLEEVFARDPEGLLQRLRRAVDEELTESDLEFGLEEVRFALENPREAARGLEAAATIEDSSSGLPDNFQFPGIDLEEIPIHPRSRKFESRDIFRWILFAGGAILIDSEKVDFRRSSDFPSRFEYRLENPGVDDPLEIALFSDFGTGLYHSRYIPNSWCRRATGTPFTWAMCTTEAGDPSSETTSKRRWDRFFPLPNCTCSTATTRCSAAGSGISSSWTTSEFLTREPRDRRAAISACDRITFSSLASIRPTMRTVAFASPSCWIGWTTNWEREEPKAGPPFC